MSKLNIASGKAGPAFDSFEEKANARYLRERRIPGTDFVITDAGLYPAKSSESLRKAADDALLCELEASLQVPR